MNPHRPHLVGSVMLGTRKTASVLLHRHPDQIRKQCRPIACDVRSRASLYDLDSVAEQFAEVPRRVA